MAFFFSTELISGVHHYDAVTAIGNRVVSMYTAVLEMTRGSQYAGKLHTGTLNVRLSLSATTLNRAL